MLFHLYYPLYSIILITIKYFDGSFRNKLFILIGRLKATNSNYAQRNILFHWRMGQSGPNAPECVSHPLYWGNTEEHRLKREIKKTNPRLIRLITDLKTLSREKDVHIWRDIAKRLERPARSYAQVNLSKINRYTIEDITVIVPGKVLGAGSIEHKVTVAALNFSDSALEKIKNKGGSCLTIEQLVEINPSGSGVKIMQ